MISALFVSTLLGAGPASGPAVGEVIDEVRRTFLEDGAERVSATTTHRVISRVDGSLELQGAQPLKLSLQSVTRAARCQTTMLGRLALLDSPHTVRSLRACDVEESWTNGPAGLEHAFTLLRAPPGTGALSLFVRVEGPWHHQDEHGHVFKGPGAAHSLRYGQAFVLRSGRRIPIEVAHVEGGLELRVPAELADAPGAFPMEIDPALTAEVELDPLLGGGPSPGLDETPAIAVNSLGTAMVVWADTRRGLGTDLFGARMPQSGGLGDPVGIPIAVAPGHQLRPTICADGAHFLVAWDTPTDGGFQIRARHVSAAGVPGQEFFVVNGFSPALAAAGDAGIKFLAYVDRNSNAQVLPISGMNVGAPVARQPIVNEVASNPAIAASDRGWFAAWEVEGAGASVSSIRGMFSGAAMPSVIPVFDNSTLNSARRPTVALVTVAATVEDAFVFWEEGINLGGARVSQLAPTLTYSYNGSSPALVRTSSALNAQPTLGALVGGRVQLRDLNDGGLSSFEVGPSPRNLALAANGARIFAAWSEAPRTESDVYGAMVANTTLNTQTMLLSRAASAQRGPRVAFAEQPNEGLAVWLEGTTAIYAAKVVEDADGLRVSPRFLVHQSTQTLEQVEVAAAVETPLFLVTWRHTQPVGIKGQLATTSSTIGQSFTLPASGVSAGPAVAWDQSSGVFLVAWSQLSVGYDIVTSTVTPAGAVSPLRTHATGAATDLAITCLRSNCLIAWEKPTRELGGLVIGSVTAVPFALPTPSGRPAVGHDGTHFFLAWHSANGLSFTRVDAMGGFIINSPTAINTNAAVTGVSMASADPPVLAWSELAGDESNVYLRRLDLQQPAELVGPGSNASVSVRSPSTEPSGAVVYQRFVGTGVNAMRSFAKGFTYVPDAGYRDAGVDAGFDAGTPDAGADAGLDAGSDAGVDAGASQEDAGVDAGLEDAGVSGDGGVVMFETSGCGCQGASGTPLLGLLLVLALRRRRR